MRILRLATDEGARPITNFGSDGLAILPVARGQGAFQIGCMRLATGGYVGRHAAVGPQLFAIVQGAGWVEGDDGAQQPITAGEAAFWEDDELHAAGTDTGMLALVIEGDAMRQFEGQP
ncbi:MAG: cupin [Ktedonobacterales bacterium]